ncbi:MAG TPA: LacI family DNA-binding transcriptional regulator [Actinomycetes bacterium]|nr:LacI family DNA-binding transcriptional regulator [Actinomycetes bacterium]
MGGNPSASRTRLRDVADLAGVSVKTVSNVVNGSAPVTAGTRAKVDAALTQLNYRPNLAARNLRRGRSGLVALAVPEIDSPYFAELARRIATAAERQGWTLLIDQTEGDGERERLVTEGFRSQLIDGLIFSPIASGRAELAHRRDRTPMVLLGERVFDGPTDHVSIDNVAAARTGVAHLLGLGRRRVAAIGRQRRPTAGTARLRLQGYVDALTAAGHDYDDALVADTDSWRRADGAAAMTELLRRRPPPDSVFCFNDLLALGAMRALHDADLRVPEDVAVVGFDDIEDGRFSTPSLTTIRPDKDRIATLAVEVLAERLADADVGRSGPARELSAPFDLVVRESTAGPVAGAVLSSG